MAKEIRIGELKKGAHAIKLKAVANEHYIIVDNSGKAINKLKFVQKDKNLEIYAEVDGKEKKIVEIEDYYAPNMNCAIVGLDEANQEIGYIYNSNDNWHYLANDTELGFFSPLIGLGAAGAAGVGVAVANNNDGNNGGNEPVSTNITPNAPTLNVSDSDNDGKINVSGVGKPGSIVTVTWPDGTITTTPTDSVTGEYTAESPTVQTNGNIKVKLTDANGNISSETIYPYTDTQEPITPTLNVTDSNNNGKIEVSGIAEPGSILTLTWPNGTIITVTTDPVTGTYSAESPAVQGSGDVKAKVTDVNGNVSEYIIAPIIPTVNTTTSTDNTPIITGTATLESGETLSVTVNGATYDNVTVDRKSVV